MCYLYDLHLADAPLFSQTVVELKAFPQVLVELKMMKGIAVILHIHRCGVFRYPPHGMTPRGLHNPQGCSEIAQNVPMKGLIYHPRLLVGQLALLAILPYFQEQDVLLGQTVLSRLSCNAQIHVIFGRQAQNSSQNLLPRPEFVLASRI